MPNTPAQPPRRLALLAIPLALAATLGGCATPSSSSPRPARTAEPARAPSANADINRGQQLRQQGNLDEALAAFLKALDDNPNLVDAHLGVGDVFRDQTDYPKAEVAYERATRVDPNNYDAHYYLGLTRQYLGKLNAAIAAYNRAILIRPDAVEAHRDLAAAYLQSDDARNAMAAAQRAVELDPDAQAAWFNLAAAQALTRRYEDAVRSYRNAAELGPLPDPVALGLADAHLKLGNLDRAAFTLLAVTSNPNTRNADAFERLGYTYFRQRKFNSAADAYQNAARIDPRNTSALNGLGAVKMTQFLLASRDAPGDFNLRDDARAFWRQSLAVNPNQPAIVDLLNRYAGL